MKREQKREFANDSEQEFAQLLLRHNIQYQYEPTTFVLLSNSDGNVLEAMSPDFYLEDYDLFIELTVMKQELVTKKNKKARKLREMYPDVNLKLLYKKEYNGLLKEDEAGVLAYLASCGGGRNE